ncbi:MAG: DapH/DapD/GlmU-related protein [Bacteroidota bacterium]|nr:DapH/DapD/GlmU-related protein [Bacteroidota bacterium]MDE2957917.1 DapH/DapD/GlmU-related protein [Bacteroidota bacterium]
MTVAASALIGSETHMGQGCIIEEDVVIGDGCIIGHQVIIRSGTRVGDQVTIRHHTALGVRPIRGKNSALSGPNALGGLKIGDECVIGSGAVLYAGCTLGTGVMVADLATVRENVTIGQGTIVGRGAAVENFCTVGAWCKLETNAYITAYSELEDHVFVAPGVTTSNDNFAGRTEERHKHYKGIVVRRGGRIGAGATVLPGRTIGRDGFLAAGSVLTRNLPAGEIWAGVPARFLRAVPTAQLLDNQ